MTINPVDGPITPYAAFPYQADCPITDDMCGFFHGKSKKKIMVFSTNQLRSLD